MVVGYTRVSTLKQDTENQKSEISRWANAHGMEVDKFVAETVSSKSKNREIFGVCEDLMGGDVLIVSELSRIARSLKELLSIVEDLMYRKVRVVFIKESIDINDNNPAGKLTISIIGSIAEFERSMISLRTKESLKSKADAGIALGRPLGSKNLKGGKLDGRGDEIRKWVNAGLNKTAIAKVMGVSRDLIYDWLGENMPESIKSNKL